MNAARTPPNVVTIAGVDPSGGAGILADVKAMSANGAYACAVVAALTAQNTVGVDGIFAGAGGFRAHADRHAVQRTCASTPRRSACSGRRR